MLTLDGSMGEGGGQVLRTSLALSLVTGTPFRINNIRARRSKPGLMRQHLMAVRAAGEVGQAEISGATLESDEVVFMPGEVVSGEYYFDIGSAGSTTLVLQTVLPPLLLAPNPSRLILEGGTHNIHAPPFDFLLKAFLPLINRMGPKVTARLERPGFYPKGGGRMVVDIEPCPKLQPLQLMERGAEIGRKVVVTVAGLPYHIVERELGVVHRRLALAEDQIAAQILPGEYGPGNVLTVEVVAEQVTEVFTGFGERGVPAESVAERLVEEAQRYLQTEVPVGEHLADQLLIPMALAGGGSFLTLAPTLHTATNIEVIGRFCGVVIEMEQIDDRRWRIRAGEAGHPVVSPTEGNSMSS